MWNIFNVKFPCFFLSLFVCLFVYLFIYLSIYLFICINNIFIDFFKLKDDLCGTPYLRKHHYVGFLYNVLTRFYHTVLVSENLYSKIFIKD